MNFPTNPIEQRLLEVLRGHDVGDVCDRLWGDASDEAPATHASHRARILGLGHSVSVRIARRDK
jgi:hypothetical protein